MSNETETWRENDDNQYQQPQSQQVEPKVEQLTTTLFQYFPRISWPAPCWSILRLEFIEAERISLRQREAIKKARLQCQLVSAAARDLSNFQYSKHCFDYVNSFPGTVEGELGVAGFL